MYIQTLAEKLIISFSKVHQSRLENCVCICNCICNCCTYRRWLDMYFYRLTGFVFVFTDWLDTGYWSNFKRFVASSWHIWSWKGSNCLLKLKDDLRLSHNTYKFYFFSNVNISFAFSASFFWLRRSQGLKKSRWPRKTSQQKLKTHLKLSATSINWNLISVSASSSMTNRKQLWSWPLKSYS